MAQMNKTHELDCSLIEDFDEINGEYQLCWVWCQTHRKLEWHSLPIEYAEDQAGIWRTDKAEVKW